VSTVLVVEDEPVLRTDLVDYLNANGIEAEGVGTAKEMRDRLNARGGDQLQIIILDVGLPDGSGFDLAQEMRADADRGIIMLTAFNEPHDRIRGFEAGADVYLVKDAPLKEVLAATQNLLRRMNATSPGNDPSRNWCLDTVRWLLRSPGNVEVKLTATEFTFLVTLMENEGRPCSREELVERVLRPNTYSDGRHLDAVVSRLRRKVRGRANEELPVKVFYGNGYVLTAHVQSMRVIKECE
jgi:DNA-binding response OmpR family regulator